tara:strand:+ start:48 stop:548 length:501 start_codon:yes stop_codon:yes gene_type:complete
MTSKKQVRGLLDVVEAEAQGEEWELAEQTLGDALGLGLGATEQARRWALIGMEHEAKMQSRRPAHRPKKENITKIDSIRAFAAWHMCWRLRGLANKPNARITNRELIRVIQVVEQAEGLDAGERLFPERGNSDASLSRGKKILGIDANWNSKVCEELQQSFTKTTG